MRQQDIKVCADLYWSTHHQWATGTGWRDRHVRVVSNKTWHRRREVYIHSEVGGHTDYVRLPGYPDYLTINSDIYQVPKRGPYGIYGVLVVTVNEDGIASSKPWVAQTQHLRGPWDECHNEVETYKLDRRRHFDAQEAEAKRRAIKSKASRSYLRNRYALELAGYSIPATLTERELDYLVSLLDAYDRVLGELSNLLESVHRVELAKDLCTRTALNREIEDLTGAKERIKRDVEDLQALRSHKRGKTA